MTNSNNNDLVKKLVSGIVSTYDDKSGTNFIDTANMPERDKILEILDLLIEVIFPGFTGKRKITRENIEYIVGDLLCQINLELSRQIELAYRHVCKLKNCGTNECVKNAEEATRHLLESLPSIREMLKEDVGAAYDGDPAAKSYEEIVLSYPGILAIVVHRIAYELYSKGVPLIPRLMSETAHERTGIDINPGAKIGRRFFIDHGTGVVVGETAVIGDNVKLYQGVTLGALSFPKDERGRIIKTGKRHPTLEDNVTVYAEATILGDITIGKDSVIGGNVWVKKSLPPGTIVAFDKAETLYKERKK